MGDKSRRDGEFDLCVTSNDVKVHTPLRAHEDVQDEDVLEPESRQRRISKTPSDSFQVEHQPTHQEAPDGGWGWVVVVATTLMFIIISSMLSSFSVLYGAYVHHFDQSIGAIGLIVAMKLLCLHFTGALCSHFVERYGCRLVSMTGFTIAGLTIFVGSFANTLPLLCVTYALTGCGVGLSYLSCMVCVQHYFTKRRSLASGITMTGFSISTLVLPPFTRWLLDMYGWRGTLMILAGLHIEGVFLSALLRPLPHRRRTRNPMVAKHKEGHLVVQLCKQLFEVSLLKDVRFMLYGAGTLCSAIGIVTFLNHFINRALSVHIEKYHATYLMSIYGVSSCVFRVAFGFVGNMHFVNRTIMYGIGIFSAGVVSCLSCFAWDFPSFTIASSLLGVCAACSASVQIPALVDMLGISRIARSAGLLQIFNGIGGLLATPVAGWLYDWTKDYRVPYYVMGIVEALGGATVLTIPFLTARRCRSEKSTDQSEMQTTQLNDAT